MQRWEYLKFLDFPPVPCGRGLIYGVLIIVVCACARDVGQLLAANLKAPKIFQNHVSSWRGRSLFFMAADWRSGDFFFLLAFFAFKNGSQIDKDFNEANNNTYLLYSLAFQPRGIPSTRSTAFAWVGSV